MTAAVADLLSNVVPGLGCRPIAPAREVLLARVAWVMGAQKKNPRQSVVTESMCSPILTLESLRLAPAFSGVSEKRGAGSMWTQDNEIIYGGGKLSES